MIEQASAADLRYEDGVGIITLSQPETFNALSDNLISSVGEALKAFEADARVRSVLIEASGQNFCTGANLKEAKQKRASKESWTAFISDGHKVFRSLEESPLPIVASVQGLCLAGGLELVLCCDVVFAGRTSKFGDQHAQYGLLPGWGGSQRLPRTVGIRRALDLFYSARWVSAEEARELGLVNYVVEDEQLFQEALGYCKTMAERSPRGLALMKRLTRSGLEMTLKDALSYERGLVFDYMLSEDADEGLAAFEQRRKPRFKQQQK